MLGILAISGVIGLSFILCGLNLSSEARDIEEYEEFSKKIDQ